jgi:ParB family chromosome partitioning protein
MKKNRLGKGLDALLSKGDLSPEEPRPSGPTTVDPTLIKRNPDQPRHYFDESKINELADSIRTSGILQPLVVQRTDDGYQLIAGERRLRAALRLRLSEVPIVLRESSDDDSIVLALIENLQREDLNPIEEADAFARLQGQFNLSQEEVAAKVGKSRPAIANSLRLLSLPEEVKAYVAQGKLPAGQARALLGLEPQANLIAAAREVAARGLSTREAEALVKRMKANKRTQSENRPDPNITAIIDTLQHRLGTKVRLKHQTRTNKGSIEIEYYSLDDLERITQAIMA